MKVLSDGKCLFVFSDRKQNNQNSKSPVDAAKGNSDNYMKMDLEQL